jgi:hypothetical protein
LEHHYHICLIIFAKGDSFYYNQFVHF